MHILIASARDDRKITSYKRSETISYRNIEKMELEELEKLSLVSKICTELENHLGTNDKVLAEFMIAMAEKHSTAEKFKGALMKNGVELPVRTVINLCSIRKPSVCFVWEWGHRLNW